MFFYEKRINEFDLIELILILSMCYFSEKNLSGFLRTTMPKKCLTLNWSCHQVDDYCLKVTFWSYFSKSLFTLPVGFFFGKWI